MRVLVCGGRDYRNPQRIREVLDQIHSEHGVTLLLIHGDASGADSSASAWASNSGVDQVKFPANWRGRGNSAGPYRNAIMLQLIPPDLVVAFPGGRGTRHMVVCARGLGVEVREIDSSANKRENHTAVGVSQ